ncbi:MAG: hypothetical protein RBT34_08735 [Anaerolineaceae bacterium]|nr:hypothetical protein [Anaerolineaceae bacterium]
MISFFLMGARKWRYWVAAGRRLRLGCGFGMKMWGSWAVWGLISRLGLMPG